MERSAQHPGLGGGPRPSRQYHRIRVDRCEQIRVPVAGEVEDVSPGAEQRALNDAQPSVAYRTARLPDDVDSHVYRHSLELQLGGDRTRNWARLRSGRGDGCVPPARRAREKTGKEQQRWHLAITNWKGTGEYDGSFRERVCEVKRPGRTVDTTHTANHTANATAVQSPPRLTVPAPNPTLKSHQQDPPTAE